MIDFHHKTICLLADKAFAHLSEVTAANVTPAMVHAGFWDFVKSTHSLQLLGADVIEEDLDRNWKTMTVERYKDRLREWTMLWKKAIVASAPQFKQRSA